MPPDHGAAAVHIILDDPELRARWLVELDAMRDRINSVRQRIAAADPRLAFIGRQFGMFSMLPLSKEQVLKLREDHAIYMADSGRFNVVGMSDDADRSIYRRRGRGAGRLIMADRDPGRVSAEVDWREVARLVLTSREMDRIEEEELVPAKKVLYQFSARGHDMAQVLLGLQLKDGDGGVRLLPLAAAAAGARRAAGRCARVRHGPGRRLFRRARYRRGVQLPQSRRRARAADVRRGGRAIYAGGGLGAGDRLQAARFWTKGRRTPSRWCSAAMRAARRADFGQR